MVGRPSTELACRGARLGEERDAAEVKVVSRVCRSFADGLSDGEVTLANAGLGVCLSLDVALGLAHNQ